MPAANPLPLSPRFSGALEYAATLHREQFRKGTTIPYIAHLLSVAALVLEAGGTEDQAIAALLHDGPEDQGGEATLRVIHERFGEPVARMVAACTDTYEDPKPEWRQRKEDYLAHLALVDDDALLVSMADKLHNVRAIAADYRVIGEAVWDRFSGAREGTLWYYRALVEAYRRRAPGPLLDVLDAGVTQLELAAQGSAGPTRAQARR